MKFEKILRSSTVAVACTVLFSMAVNAIPVFNSPRMAFVETFEKSPRLRVYDPSRYSYTVIDFEPGLNGLKPAKRTDINLFANVVSEFNYSTSVLKGLEIVRGTSRAPETNPILDAYKQGIPFYLNLKDQQDAASFFKNLRASFEKEGVTRGQVMPSEKPLALILMDGKDAPLSPEDEALVSEYFTRVSYADKEARDFFENKQRSMMQQVKEVMSVVKEFATDSALDIVARDYNREVYGFKKNKVGSEVAKWMLRTAVGIPAGLFIKYGMEKIKGYLEDNTKKLDPTGLTTTTALLDPKLFWLNKIEEKKKEIKSVEAFMNFENSKEGKKFQEEVARLEKELNEKRSDYLNPKQPKSN